MTAPANRTPPGLPRSAWLFAALLATPAPAQNATTTPAATLDRLVGELRDPARRASALQQLAALGADAAPALAENLRSAFARDDLERHADVLLVLARMGAAATPATAELVRQLEAAAPATQRQLLRTLARIGPAAGAALPGVVDLVRDTATPSGPVRQEQNVTLGRLELGDAPTRERILDDLHKSSLVRVSAVAMWLADHPQADEEIRRALLTAHERAVDRVQRHGDTWDRLLLETSRAVVRVAPDRDEAESAWTRLLACDDPIQRREAAVALRQFPGAAVACVPALVEALSDADRNVAREALISLGFFDEGALQALPALQVLAAGPDRELRHLAAHTRERICGGLTPIPAAVAQLVTVAGDDAERAGTAVAALGPRAVPFLVQLLQWRPDSRPLGPPELAALVALRELGTGGAAAAEVLRALALRDEPHAALARDALAAMGLAGAR